MKERLTAILLLLFAFLTIWAITKELPDSKATYGTIPPKDAAVMTKTEPAVASEVIRLHILADSDSDIDQQIKLSVRDALLPYLHAATLTATSREEALTLLNGQCDVFTDVVNRTLASHDVCYSGTVTITSLYFPLRIYGSQTWLSEDAVFFPPGVYDSIQVILGEGKGHNWWCLAYPSLCFIDASYDYVPKDSPSYDKVFTTVKAETLERLFQGTISTETSKEVTVYFDSKLWRMLCSLFKEEP